LNEAYTFMIKQILLIKSICLNSKMLLIRRASLLFIGFILSNQLYSQDLYDFSNIITTKELVNSVTDSLDRIPEQSQKLEYALWAFDAYYRRGDFFEADTTFIKYQDLIQVDGPIQEHREAIRKRAEIISFTSNVEASFEYFDQLIEFYLSQNDESKIFEVKLDKVNFYLRKKQENQVSSILDSLKSSLDNPAINSLIKAKWHLLKASYLNEFGNNNDNALFHLKSAQSLLDNNKSHLLYAEVLYELALNQTEWSTSKQVSTLEDALKIFKEESYHRKALKVLNQIGLIYAESGDILKSIEVLQNVENSNYKNSFCFELIDTYYLLSKNSLVLNDSANWFKYSTYLKDSRINKITREYWLEREELKAKFERDKAEQDLYSQRAITQELEETAELSKKGYISLLVASALVAGLAFSNYVLHKRLKRKNKEIEGKNNTLLNINESLTKELEKKNVLFKELNHRVKNNLSLLAGLIYLQESSINSEKEKNIHKTLRNRIQSISLVHQNLYLEDKHETLEFEKYLKDLAKEVSRAVGYEDKVELIFDCKKRDFNLDETVPLAMIINELMSNSFKHAFENIDHPSIKINTSTNNGMNTIYYKDNGSGKKEPKKESLGLRLVRLLTEQLDGQLEISINRSGFNAKIHWPASNDSNLNS